MVRKGDMIFRFLFFTCVVSNKSLAIFQFVVIVNF